MGRGAVAAVLLVDAVAVGSDAFAAFVQRNGVYVMLQGEGATEVGSSSWLCAAIAVAMSPPHTHTHMRA